MPIKRCDGNIHATCLRLLNYVIWKDRRNFCIVFSKYCVIRGSIVKNKRGSIFPLNIPKKKKCKFLNK